MSQAARCKSCNRFLKHNSHGTLCLTCVERYDVQKSYVRVPLGVGESVEGLGGQNLPGGKNVDPQLVSLLKELVNRVEGGQGKRKLPQAAVPPAKRVAYGSESADLALSYDRERERDRERDRDRWSHNNHTLGHRGDEWDMRSPSGRTGAPRADEWDMRNPPARSSGPRPDEWDVRPSPSARPPGPRPDDWDVRPSQSSRSAGPRPDEWDMRAPPSRSAGSRPDEWDMRPSLGRSSGPRSDEWETRPQVRPSGMRPDDWDTRPPPSNRSSGPRPDDWDVRPAPGRSSGGPRPDDWDVRPPGRSSGGPRPDDWEVRPLLGRSSGGPRPDDWDTRPSLNRSSGGPRPDDWDARPPNRSSGGPRPDEWDARPPPLLQTSGMRGDDWDMRPPPGRGPGPRSDEWDARPARSDEWEMRSPAGRSLPRNEEWDLRPTRLGDWDVRPPPLLSVPRLGDWDLHRKSRNEWRPQARRSFAAQPRRVNRLANVRTAAAPRKKPVTAGPSLTGAKKKAQVQKGAGDAAKKEEKTVNAVDKTPVKKETAKKSPSKADGTADASEETEVKERERETFQFSPGNTPEFVRSVCGVLNLEVVEEAGTTPAANKYVFFPPNKLFEALVVKEWKQLDKKHIKSNYCKKLYSFPREWCKLWEIAPAVDSSVASVALQTKEPVKPAALPKGIVERRIDIASRRAFMACGEVISTAIASSLVTQALSSWLEQIAQELPEDAEARTQLSQIQLCVQYLSDATRDIVKGGARASVAQINARRAVWLRNWNPREQLQSQLLKIPFQGGLLFGKEADALMQQYKQSERNREAKLKLTSPQTPRSQRGRVHGGLGFAGGDRMMYREPPFPDEMESDRFFSPERRLPSYSEYLNFIEHGLRSYPGDYPEDLPPPRFFGGSPMGGREFPSYPEEEEERRFMRTLRAQTSFGGRGRGKRGSRIF
ncbi:uncharacterized protein LOC122811959 [Protopterus annectens]|uniref:uncharacterized protein LOC122811959 n=1 Tax=Protopterus annectens TaxID=7888 RepID=UPI001CFA2D03|nr:uncharacterized protein LOC122811959 [Protopterus annectens]